MHMKFEQKESGPERLIVLADKLDELQRPMNKGKGVSCVQTVIIYLRQGNVEKAKAVCWNESDKIDDTEGRYSEIRELLTKELFRGEPNHPWRIIDDYRKRKNEDQK
jgi:hypothetical protein